MKQTTRKGLRLHIGIFGRRNVGKSSLLNSFTRQEVALVSNVAGTTTDPVEKPMELQPLGPVLFIDTAGIDDEGALGELRISSTKRVFDRTELAILVAEAASWGHFEESLVNEFQQRKVPFIVVFNKCDLGEPSDELLDRFNKEKVETVEMIATEGEGTLDLRRAVFRSVPEDFLKTPDMIGDLVPSGEMAVLVAPIDKEAPKGRLILPQVQAIRNLLDNNSYCMVVQDGQLAQALQRLNRPPALVITDSQAFEKVGEATPDDILLTSFSILFARMQGDLNEMVCGAASIAKLRPGARVLIAEACSHHPIEEDIGRVKIPKWLAQSVGGGLQISHVQGHDFPPDLAKYDLVIHCGACMWNRREMLSRIDYCRQSNVPITNYGLAIAWSLGIFERALGPFSDALESYHKILKGN
jgi:[FeFe] hydrogenase H-cluster maturation GTPase HydF